MKSKKRAKVQMLQLQDATHASSSFALQNMKQVAGVLNPHKAKVSKIANSPVDYIN